MQRDKIYKWKRWAKWIHDEVSDLVLRWYVWAELVKMIERNPEIQKPSVFHDWLPIVYAHTQLMSIRRMVDRDRRATSLSNLIWEIRDNQETARAHADETPILIECHRIEREIPPAADDLKRLHDRCEPTQAYADKRIAHRDGRGPERPPKFADRTAAIDLLHELTRSYCGFMMTEDFREPEPVFAYDWQQIFRVPWDSPQARRAALSDSGEVSS